MIRLYPSFLSINKCKKGKNEHTNMNLKALSRMNNFVS